MPAAQQPGSNTPHAPPAAPPAAPATAPPTNNQQPAHAAHLYPTDVEVRERAQLRVREHRQALVPTAAQARQAQVRQPRACSQRDQAGVREPPAPPAPAPRGAAARRSQGRGGRGGGGG